MPVIHLSLRSAFPTDATSSSSLKPEYIAGFVIVGVLVLAVAIWLGVRKYRKHALAKRESQLGAAFLSVRGIRPEDEKVESAGYVFRSFSFPPISSNKRLVYAL
jgi:hypothetical protein